MSIINIEDPRYFYAIILASIISSLLSKIIQAKIITCEVGSPKIHKNIHEKKSECDVISNLVQYLVHWLEFEGNIQGREKRRIQHKYTDKKVPGSLIISFLGYQPERVLYFLVLIFYPILLGYHYASWDVNLLIFWVVRGLRI